MRIDFYITDLLFSNDCVIVPGFGGFVSNYTPAKIHPVNHTFYPPSKSILFNSKLTSDDGLLLHSISVAEGISYEEAKRKVDIYVHEIKHELNAGHTVKLEKIGTIIKDQDGRYLFEQEMSVNYLEESYGLSTFISPPVLRSGAHRPFDKKYSDRKFRPSREFRNKKKYYTSVVLVPVILLIGWLIISPEMEFHDTQQSGLFSLSDQKSNLDESSNEFRKSDNKIPSENQEPIQTHELLAEKPADKNKAESNLTLTYKYYIIGGAFRSRENADKMLAELKDEGYSAEEAGQNSAGLFMISYFSSWDKTEAMANLGIIRQEKNPSAWLLKK